MELANLTSYRSSDGHSTDGETTNNNRKCVEGRTLPVYLLQDCPLPGIPKGKKLQKRAPKKGSFKNQMSKSYVPIDTTRTDFSKFGSDMSLQLDTTRTDEIPLNFSTDFETPHEMELSSRTPYNTETPRDLPEFVFPSYNDMNKHLVSTHRNMTQSELSHAHTRTVGKDLPGQKIRRNSQPRHEDGKTTESAPPSGRAHRRTSHGNESRADTTHVKRGLENLDYEPNPDVAPYQPANFMSSTILKKVPIPKRHLDTFGGYEYNFMGKRGVMLHTDRYQVDFIKSFDGMTQRDRLQAGLNYVEAMRGTKRRRELVPHRAKLDLIMGGKQIEFEERFYISRELQKLKALAMPDIAKDLYHGRGIHLPGSHNSLKPRYPLPNDIEEEAMASAPSSLQTVLRKSDSHNEFPRIDRDPTFLGKGTQLRTRSTFNRHPQLPSIRGRAENGFDVIPTHRRQPPRGSFGHSLAVSKSTERRTVTNLSARLGLSHRLNRDVTSLTRSHTQAPPPSRDNGQDQSQHFITKGRSGPSTTRKISPSVDMTVEDGQSRVTESETEATDMTKQIAPSTLAPSGQETIVESGIQDGVAPSDEVPVDIEGVPPEAPSEAPAVSEARARPSTEEGLSRTTPNPLRGADLTSSVPQDEQEELRQTFQRLDTDMDGHIKYTQLKTQLPKAFSGEQERFIEEVYNLTNSITFFGVDEFMAMDRLSKTVEGLAGKAKDAYETLDFGTIADHLLKYVGKFDQADSGNHGVVNIEALQNILSETVNNSLTTDMAIWEEVLDMISVDYGTKITKISFIAHIPLFLNMEKDYK